MLVGIDEVGRGCWAGPLVVGAVMLQQDIPGLADSKQLSARRRAVLHSQIIQHAQVGLGWVSAQEIDNLGLAASLRLAARRAFVQLAARDASQIIIDGTVNLLPGDSRVQLQKQADASVPCVSAASIVAKVERDAFMHAQSRIFPDYGFEHHVGYGTKRHRHALEVHGVTSLHRRSFRPVQSLVLAEAEARKHGS